MQLKTLGEQTTLLAAAYKKLGGGVTSIAMVQDAVAGLTAENTMAVISTLELTDAEKIEILISNGASRAKAEQMVATYGLATSEEGATVATLGLKNAFKGLWATILSNPYLTAGAALLAVLGILKKVHDAQEQAKQDILENAEAAKDKISDVKQSLDSASETVEKVGKRYAELAQGVNSLTNKNISLTTDEYAEFLKISNQLAEVFPNLTKGYDDNGNAILDLSGDVDTIVGSLTNLVEVQRQAANLEIAQNLPDLYKGAIAQSREYNKEISNYKNTLEEVQGVRDEIIGEDFLEDGILHIRGAGDNLYNFKEIEKDYLKVLDELGYKYELLEKENPYSEAVPEQYKGYMRATDLPDIGAKYRITSFATMSDEEIAEAKKQIQSGLSKYSELYSTEMGRFSNEIQAATNKNKTNWSGLTQALTAWLSTDTTYQTLSDEMQSMVQSMVSNIDFSELNFDSWEQASNYIIDNIVEPISKVAQDHPEVQQAYIDLFSLDSNLSYSDYMAHANKAVKIISKGLNKTYDEIVKAVGYDNKLNDLGAKRNRILTSLFSTRDIRNGTAESLVDSLSLNQIDQAFNYIKSYGVSSWKELQSAFANNTYGSLIDIKAETESLKNFNTAISESASATGMSADSLTHLSERYKEVEGHEAALSNLYTKTTLGIRVNVKSVRELEKAYNTQKKEKQIKQIESLKVKYNDLTTAMRNTTDATKYATLYEQRSNIAQQIDDASTLASQYQALASSYNAWQAAMSSDNPSDPYANIQSGYEKIGKLIEQGWYHKDEVDTYLDLLLNPEIRTTNNEADYEKLAQEIKNTGFSVKDFFITDDDGNLVTDGVYNFFDAINKGLGDNYVKILSDGSYWWDLTGNKTEEVAKYLGVSTEFVEWMQQAMGDITGDISFEGMFEDFTLTAKDAEEALTSLVDKFKNAKEQYHIDDIYLNTNSLEEANRYIENLGSLIKDKFIGKDGTIDLTINGAEEATIVMSALIQQKAELTAPAVMSIDTESLTNVDTQMSNALSLLQQFIQLSAQLETQKSLGLDTTNTQTQLVNVANSLNGLPKEIKTKIGIDSKDVSNSITNISNTKITAGVQLKSGDVDKVKEAIAGIDPKTIELLTNSADTISDLNKVEEFSIHDKKFEIQMSGYARSMNNLKNLDEYQFAPKTITVTTVHNDVGNGEAQGTAHASGTAYRSGDWGAKDSGEALGGEVGTEILVRNGRFFTIGENGAEFFHYKKNDIIFNAEQSRQLLQNGKITNGRRRGVVYASGTAFYNGGSTGTAPSRRKANIEAAVVEAAAEELANSTPDGGSNNPEDSFKYIDRVEIFIDRIQRKIKTLSTSIKDIFSLWSDRGNGITQQIRNITEEIEIQKGAAKRYLEEARKQIDKYDLDPEWVKSLETGNLGFIYLTNLDELHEGYQEYLKWYEKYLDCRDSIVGLEQDLSQLYKDQFDNTKSNYENQINLNDYLRDAEEKTYTQSTEYFDDMRSVYSKNLELLTSEAKDLEEQLQKAVDSDAVEVGSEAWQEMKKDINSVTKEIAKTNVELAKLYTEQFDYIQNNYQNQISSYESLNDANEKNFTATTNYFTEMREISHKTLKTQQEELADLEREFDEAMDSGRIEEGSEAWYKMRGAIDDTKRSIFKTKVELKQLYLDEFSYIQDGFKNQLSLYEYYSNVYQKKATIAETQGYMASSKALAAQKNVQLKNTSILREELVALEKEFSEAIATGKIEEGSEAWYSMQSAINATKEAIYDSRIEVENLNKAMRELEWEKFDFKQSMTGQLNDEADFLMNMMSFTDLYDKKGRLTDTGLATMGLHNLKADVYQKQANDYLQEVTETELALYNDPDNVELLNRRQELLKLSRETAIAMENEQKAIVSMVENGIKLELDSLKELIDTYKTALDSQKDLYDYQKTVADKSKDIVAIQKQLSAYANDNSEETKATVQKLKVDLSDAQNDLADTEYNRSITDQKKLLDEIYTEYETFLNTRLDDTNKLLEDMRMITNAIPDRIGEVLRDTSWSASIHISTEMNGIWNEAAAELQRWNENAEAQQQITRDTLNAADASWGSFGDALRGSVVDKYSETNENINGVGDKADNIKTAVDMNAHGIETVFSDLEHQSGQIVANADDNADGIKDEIYRRDTTPHINKGFTTVSDALEKIEEHVVNIEKKAEEMAAPYLGDVNLDDNIDSADALKILRGGIGAERLNEQEKALADINGDGMIDSADALTALRIGIGLDRDKKVKAKSYSSGGLINYTGTANVHGTERDPELVLNAKDTKNFIRLNDILREAIKTQSLDLLSGTYGMNAPVLQLAKMPSLISGMSAVNKTQDVQIVNNIEIDHVDDYNDLVNKFKTDQKFENMVFSMTVGRLNGGRSIDKYKYKW